MIISKTPLRISFFGGGTDLQSFWVKDKGRVINSAIDKFIFVAVEKNDKVEYRLDYGEKEFTYNIDEIEHDIIRECIKLTGINFGLTISVWSDITSNGSGLGSSSSLTVGLLNSLYKLNSQIKDPEFLAGQACHIEIDILQKPIGKQDQYIAAYGGIRTFDFHKNGEVTNELVKMNKNHRLFLEKHLLLLNLNMPRKSKDILSHQNSNALSNHSKLLEIRDHVQLAESYIKKRDIESIGDLLKQGWHIKKQLSSQISNSMIDYYVNRCMDQGALGAKVTGAGGGGHILVVCKPEKRKAIVAALDHLEELPIKLYMDGSTTIINSTRQLNMV